MKKQSYAKINNHTVVQLHKENFHTLSKAFADQNVALVECTLVETGEKVATICAVNENPDTGEHEFVPFAIFLNGNPYNLLKPPAQGKGGKS